MRLIASIMAVLLGACNNSSVNGGGERYITVNDTDFSKGRLGLRHEITLSDLEQFHGHRCDGLLVGFLGLKEGLAKLYPDGIVDRTNTRVVSKSSPCLTDAAIYLTGGRIQYNTFYVSDAIKGLFIIQRIDTGTAVEVQLRPGVKPAIIDEMGARAVKKELSPCEIDQLKNLEEDFSNYLLNSNPSENFEITVLDSFKWEPVLRNDFIKTDILNKSAEKCDR